MTPTSPEACCFGALFNFSQLFISAALSSLTSDSTEKKYLILCLIVFIMKMSKCLLM